MRRWLWMLAVGVALGCGPKEPGPECKGLLLDYDDKCPLYKDETHVEACSKISKEDLKKVTQQGDGLEAERKCHALRTQLTDDINKAKADQKTKEDTDKLINDLKK